jgi:RND superfamily putative drug exporter
MLASWGRWVYRFRWWVLIISVLSLGPAGWLTSQGGHLGSTIIPANTKSARALDLIKSELPPTLPSFGLIFRSPSLRVTAPAFHAAVERAVTPLRIDPRVAKVHTTYDAGEVNSRSISRDGHSTIVKVELKDASADDSVLAMDIYPALRAKVQSDTLKVLAFGILPRMHDFTVIPETDIRRAELVVLPLVGLLLVFVFRSVLAAALPLAVGVLAVTGGMACTLALSRITPVLVFATSIIVMVGLGVAIDYSLFIVSRFREEVHRHSAPDALARTMETTGRAILFSGGTVAIGLLGMLLLGLGPLNSLGLAGTIVVSLAVIYAMTFLPALLGILGPRIDTWSLPFLKADKVGHGGFWRRLANMVMAHPWGVLLPATAFLLLLGAPFQHIRLSPSDVTVLPPTAESRQSDEMLHREFQEPDTNPIVVLVHYTDGSPLSSEHAGRIYDLSRWLARLPAVTRVNSIVDLDPSMGRNQYLRLLTQIKAQLPPGVQVALKQMVGADIVMLVAQTSLSAGSDAAMGLVRTIRGSHPPVDGDLMVTGESAFHVDFMETMKRNTPAAIGLIVLVTYLLLFLLLGSLLLPLKAVLMNMLSISASYGALVWIFQYGHLASWLHFTPGHIETMTPIMMFCVLFGLSMDYEVLLLSRVREEYERIGDNTRAVAEGLEHTGRLITGAASIMAAVLFAFGFAHMVVIKAIGIGMGIAVVVDATIVRALIVPATMRLLGRWNWWAPGPLVRLYLRINLGAAKRPQTK